MQIEKSLTRFNYVKLIPSIEIKMETRYNRPRDRLLLLLLLKIDVFFSACSNNKKKPCFTGRIKMEKGMSTVLIYHVSNYYNTGKYFDLFSRFTINYVRQWLIYYICMKWSSHLYLIHIHDNLYSRNCWATLKIYGVHLRKYSP